MLIVYNEMPVTFLGCEILRILERKKNILNGKRPARFLKKICRK